MSLIILIPTFKRPDTLYWSLKSVISQKFYGNNLSKSIHILNNDPFTAAKVDFIVAKLLAEYNNHEFNDIVISQGNTSLPAIKNIYTFLDKITENEDIAIIHGDDDIMLPDTLLERYNAAVTSDKIVTIAKAIGTCYFFENKKGIFLDSVIHKLIKHNEVNFKNAKFTDLTNYSIPFFSVYNYRISDGFWKIYNQAIAWADEQQLPTQVKYPFVPFYIGLSSFLNKKLGCSNSNIVIRGQYLKNNVILPSSVITEYANTGVIMLTGLSVLNNLSLKDNPDFDNLRSEFRNNSLNFLFQSFFRRGGLSFAEYKSLIKLSNIKFSYEVFLCLISLNSLRNLFNNIFFDTRYLKQKIFGWGRETSNEEFWNLIDRLTK